MSGTVRATRISAKRRRSKRSLPHAPFPDKPRPMTEEQEAFDHMMDNRPDPAARARGAGAFFINACIPMLVPFLVLIYAVVAIWEAG